jgi:hypothetical protein
MGKGTMTNDGTHPPDRAGPTAHRLLVLLVNSDEVITPQTALELAGMLCHIAGGDGRGVYSIEHDPEGDRI